MKTITLPPDVDGKAMLVGILSDGRERGMDIGEMRRRFKLLDKVEACDGALALEDAEYTHLQAVWQSAKFIGAHRDILKMDDAIASAA